MACLYGTRRPRLDAELMGCLLQGRKRTSLADALVVTGRIVADNVRFLHLDAEMLLHEPDGGKDGKVGVAFAATRHPPSHGAPDREYGRTAVPSSC